MRVAIHTLGTRGDVQPYVALALGLQARGHEVQIAAPVQFEGFVRGNNLSFVPLPGDFLALLDTPEGKAAVAGGKGFGAGLKLLKHVKPMMGRLFDEEWKAVRAFAPGLIVYHPKSIAAPLMAKALEIPYVLASPLPGFTPTSAFPSPLLPFSSLGPLNRLSHVLATHGAALLFRGVLREWQAGIPVLAGKHWSNSSSGTLYAYSPHVLPLPHDWGADVLVSGYWFLDDKHWAMPPSLNHFLQAGDKPIYVGFGSMPGIEPEKLAAIAIDALLKAGKRGLLAVGAGAIQISSVPSHIHVITSAPHDQLFNHVSGAVHHGGAGTTAAAIRAGIPSGICPFFGDQPFWARRVVELGIGPQPLDRKTVTVESFARALVAMDQFIMRKNADILGAKVRAEDGVGAAVRFLEAKTKP
ncbi:glycosyltransferase [Rhizobium herbae]